MRFFLSKNFVFQGLRPTKQDIRQSVCLISTCILTFRKTFSLAFSKIQVVENYQCCVLNGWARLYFICYSPLVAKSSGFLAAKKGLKSSFNRLKLFSLRIFDQLVGFYYKNSYSFLSHGPWINSPFGPFGLEE